MDPATKYCSCAPFIPAYFAEMGGNKTPLLSCRINNMLREQMPAIFTPATETRKSC